MEDIPQYAVLSGFAREPMHQQGIEVDWLLNCWLSGVKKTIGQVM